MQQSEFRNAVEDIRTVAIESNKVWNTLLLFTDEMFEICSRMANGTAGEPTQIAKSIVDELNRWRADMLLAEDAANATISRAELILHNESGTGAITDHHLQWLMPWHTAIFQEQQFHLNLSQSNTYDVSSCYRTVPGLAPLPLRMKLRKFPVSGNLCLSETLLLDESESIQIEPFPMEQLRHDWHCWQTWAEQMANQFEILAQSEGWNQNISWSRSDATAWALLALNQNLRELTTSCHNQIVWIEMISIIQRRFKDQGIQSSTHPLHLEYLRIRDLIEISPPFEFHAVGGEEE